MSVRDSLAKLQTDWIDILYLHWWDWTTGIEEVMDSLDILVKSGKVLYLGISDTPAWIVSAANEYARSHGKTPFSIYQGRWNVMLRDFERDILPMARHYGMALAPWDAIGSGKFQSKKALEERKKNGEKLRQMMGGPEQTEDEAKMSEALCKVGEEHGVESPTAVALAYLLSKAPNVFPIVGGRKVEHLHDNIKALSIKVCSHCLYSMALANDPQLTPKQIEYLESVKPLDIGFPMNFVGEDPHVVSSTLFEQTCWSSSRSSALHRYMNTDHLLDWTSRWFPTSLHWKDVLHCGRIASWCPRRQDSAILNVPRTEEYECTSMQQMTEIFDGRGENHSCQIIIMPDIEHE